MAAPVPLPAADPPEKSWLEESTEDYGTRAAQQIPYRPDPPRSPIDLVFEGPCPRCEHAFVYRWPLVIVRGAGIAPTEPVTVYCQCTVSHPGRPEKTDGCGAYWSVSVPVSNT